MHGGDLRDAGCDDALAAQIEQDYRHAPLEPALRALLDHAEKLTRRPASCDQADVDSLLALGWTEAQVHSAVLTASYFNFINRVAEGLGVDPEPEIRDRPPLSPWEGDR